VTFTFFDFVILLALVGGAALGFFRGALRQAVATLMLYLSIVASALVYRDVSRFLARLTGQAPPATDVLAFFLTFGVTLVVLFVIRYELIQHINMERFGVWHNIVGMAFGFLNAAVVCAILVIVLRSTVSGDTWYAYKGIQAFFRRQFARSWMVYVFRPFTELILTAV
jgi:uncharacterized membrane protein required for colicin V production